MASNWCRETVCLGRRYPCPHQGETVAPDDTVPVSRAALAALHAAAGSWYREIVRLRPERGWNNVRLERSMGDLGDALIEAERALSPSNADAAAEEPDETRV